MGDAISGFLKKVERVLQRSGKGLHVSEREESVFWFLGGRYYIFMLVREPPSLF